MTQKMIYEYEDQETEHQHIENTNRGAIKLMGQAFLITSGKMITDEKVREQFGF